MTKELMVDWIKSCVFHKRDIQEAYLIVDSWSSFRDIDRIKEAAPEDDEWESIKAIKINDDSDLKDLFPDDHVLFLSDYFSPKRQAKLYGTAGFELVLLLTAYLVLCGAIVLRTLQLSTAVLLDYAFEED
ncbi:unnamed protein product [Heligmosomoides polygyrus]|uniref:DDE-1 domain-containing protein n=1 Tax=Heligmosomoides polygyrus TaxID=6339 RepID=A0A183FD24_HELPZ|nr:unnamed protein product [Heligmosomoides polygyrus]